jgi:hypothetical protein
MNRLPQRRSSAIRAEAGPEDRASQPDQPESPAPARIRLGWRLALLVWILGFVAIFGWEVGNAIWKVVKGWFG